jgi:hypothetical protein
MTICETLKRLLSGVERITKNMNKNRALSIDSGTKEIAPLCHAILWRELPKTV